MTDRAERFTDWGQPGAGTVSRPRQCPRCRHARDTTRWLCDAFPDGIPAVILTDRHDHRRHYPGDHGIRFAPRPGTIHPADEDQP